ncbi:MAG: hypothetical protein K9H49_12465 [Bacteroidales bacterium]|nr:hypothetical protein [Bacteroidales bacterium]MCF8390610.1 hypothetical protein [Bacteroidales bacterium]
MSTSKRAKILWIEGFMIFLISLSYSPLNAANYYVDYVGGSDGNNGISPVSAWQNLTKVNATTFLPGDSILLKFGSVWNNQQLAPKGSGAENNPIIVSAYGNPDEGKPVLNGNGAVRDVVYLSNQEWIEVQNLEITNFKAIDLIDNPASFKRGVYIVGNNCAELTHIYLINLYIHSINGYGVGSNEGKDNGGIFFEIRGTSVKSWFNDFLIENCHIYDVVRTGISNRSTWNGSSLEWVPSHDIRIRNTIVEKAGFNAMIPRYADNTLVEYCTFINNGLYGNGNAIFQTSSDNTIYQFNEAYGTVFNPDDHDAAGFDGGGYNHNTLIQYNYSHDNGLGGIVIGLSNDIPNDGARIRYNILQDNERQAFRFSGPTNNATISNNTIYIGPELSFVNIIFHKKLGQSPDNISYYNNIFYVEGENCYYTFGESTKVSFSHNLFYGKHPATEPEDDFKITADPLLLDAGSGGNGMNTVDGYKLSSNSPCIDAGIAVDGNNGGYDFWGNPVPNNEIPDIGAHEWSDSGTSLISDIAPSLAFYPSPSSDFVTIKFANRIGNLLVFNMRSNLVYSGQIVTDLMRLDIRDWESGLCIMKIQNQKGGTETAGKLMVQR